MKQFINLDEPKESNPQFLLISILQFSYFVLINAIVWAGSFYSILPLLAFYYLISLSLKSLIWIVVSRTINSSIKVSRWDFLLFALLIDFKEAYRFDRLKQIKIKYFWMVIYNLQCMSSYIFLFVFLQDQFLEELHFEFLQDDFYIKLIMYLTSIYIIIGMILGNYMLVAYLAVNPTYPISFFRKFILSVFIFSKIFAYIYLLIQAMDNLVAGCLALGFRIILIIFYSFYISKNNIYARFRLTQLIPFLPIDRLIQLVRNLLRGYLIYGMNIDMFPIMMKVSNTYDRMVFQTSFIYIRLINTIEVIALLIYDLYFRVPTIKEKQFFFQESIFVIFVYLVFNAVYFISQIIMRTKNSFPSLSLDNLPEVDQNERDQDINVNINSSLLQSGKDISQVYLTQIVPNRDSSFFIQLEILSTSQQLQLHSNQQKLALILQSIWQSNFIKNVMLVIDDQLMLDINRNKCYLFINTKNIDIILSSLIECQQIHNKKIIFIFKEQMENSDILKVKKAVVKHMQNIQLIQFDSHYNNRLVDEEVFQQISPFYSFFIQEFLQISAYYQTLAQTQSYNPFHILYDLYDDS